MQQGIRVPAVRQKKVVLAAVCDVYSRWVEGLSLACRKGCAACCTRSVFMTDLEGEVILDWIRRTGREKWLQAKLGAAGPATGGPGMTTNQFAEACLLHREIDEEAEGSWDFRPCVFLEKNVCSIYGVRPFGCRSFGSLIQCAGDRAAEMTPIHLTVNTVFTQIIEHLSSDGGCWSNMADILQNLATGDALEAELHLPAARPIPGFLLEPYEVPVVRILLQQVSGYASARGIVGDLIDNCMPI